MLQNNWFRRLLCVHRDMKRLGSLESTKEARVRIFRALQTFRVLHISMNAC